MKNKGDIQMLYLDNAATTKPNLPVLNAIIKSFQDYYNPSSLYSSAKCVKEKIEKAREYVAQSINAEPNEIYFTSSGSEANTWAIRGFFDKQIQTEKTVYCFYSKTEHKSITSTMLNIEKQDKLKHIFGFKIPVNKQGFVDSETLINEIKEVNYYNTNEVPYPSLISVQYVNSELGTIQNIKELAETAHKYNAVFHCDAVQAYGHISIDVKDLNVDMMSFSGHKIGTPKGIGFLYIKNGIEITPLICGSQENGMRGGTENVPYIIGLGKAAKLARKTVIKQNEYVDSVKKYLIQQLKENFDCTVNTPEKSVSNIVNITFNHNITGESLVYMLDMANIYISTGSACNSHSNKPSATLKAIGLTDEQALKTIRISLPNDNSITESNIDMFINELIKCVSLTDKDFKRRN